MGIAYLAALVLGVGILAVQLVGIGGDADADADGGHDFDTDHGDAGADAADDHHGGDGSTVLATFLSLRFWTFAAFAFGLTGTLLHHFELMDRSIVPFVAVALGLASGYFASWTFRALAQASTTSGAHSDEAIGQVGRVLIPVERGRRGKIRIELRGQTLDYLATTDEEALVEGAQVLVEEVRGDTVHVSTADPAFLPPKRDD